MTVSIPTELVSLDAIRTAAKTIAPVVIRTPLLPADDLSDKLGISVFVKPENLQRVGAFKLRGAYNLVHQLVHGGERPAGVITYSSGNHGQAVAFAARKFGVPAVIVMPETVSPAKRAGVERLGGEVVLAGRTSQDRYQKAMELAAARDLAVVPPFDHAAIIAGQGTVGLEIVEDCPDVATVLVPTGGGGLSAGVATAVRALRPKSTIITVEPAGAPKFSTAFRRRERVQLDKTESIADGLITLSVGALNFEHLMRAVSDAVIVPDAAIRRAVRFGLDRLKLVLEPSGAATLAWLMEQPRGALEGPVVAILSGGNIEWPGLQKLLSETA